MALASTRQFRSQGPVSVQAHRTGGVTEAQEGAIGVGGEIRVGGGNGDGSGVGDGNGDVNGHGDGDGAGVETGVGVNEGAQDGNGDGSGDRAGMGTEVETHRRTPDGNGDGPKVSSEDGNGDEGNGNEGRVGDGEKEAKKRKKPLNSLIVQAYRVRRSTSRYGLSHRDQSRRDVWMGVITPHFRDRCITPSWMNALGHFLSIPSLSSLLERPV